MRQARFHYSTASIFDDYTELDNVYSALPLNTESLLPPTAPPQPHISTNMGWLPWGSGSAEDDGVKKTSGGAFESPSRSNRKQCYAARDAFFECLDKNNILDSINTKNGRTKATTFCGQLDQDFEKNCAHSWVEYFKKQRVVNYQREQTIKKIESQGGEIVAPQLPLPGSK